MSVCVIVIVFVFTWSRCSRSHYDHDDYVHKPTFKALASTQAWSASILKAAMANISPLHLSALSLSPAMEVMATLFPDCEPLMSVSISVVPTHTLGNPDVPDHAIV